MGMCPLCNGFRNVDVACPSCGSKMENTGKEMDYYDDYSAYMPIDQMKLFDGYPNDFKNGECPHLFKCPSCGKDKIEMIKE
nr:hypothetical protein [Mesobacillus harenae]